MSLFFLVNVYDETWYTETPFPSTFSSISFPVSSLKLFPLLYIYIYKSPGLVSGFWPFSANHSFFFNSLARSRNLSLFSHDYYYYYYYYYYCFLSQLTRVVITTIARDNESPKQVWRIGFWWDSNSPPVLPQWSLVDAVYFIIYL